MKPLTWMIIIFSICISILGGIILITRGIIDPPKSWWWTGAILIFYAISGITVGIIFLVIKLKKKPQLRQKIDPQDAEERAKLYLKYDNDNPDNFIREDRMIMRVGQAGTERTPILWLMGKGSETRAKIDIVINLNNSKKEIEFLFNKKDAEIKEAIRLIAENTEQEVTEERVVGMDEFGRPTTTIKTKRMSLAEKKEEEEKKEAEELNAY